MIKLKYFNSELENEIMTISDFLKWRGETEKDFEKDIISYLKIENSIEKEAE